MCLLSIFLGGGRRGDHLQQQREKRLGARARAHAEEGDLARIPGREPGEA